MMPLLQVAIILLVTAIAGLYASCRRAATGGPSCWLLNYIFYASFQARAHCRGASSSNWMNAMVCNCAPSSSCFFSGLSATSLRWAAGRWEAAAAYPTLLPGPPDPVYLLYRRT